MALMKDPWSVLEPQLRPDSVSKLVPLAGEPTFRTLVDSETCFNTAVPEASVRAVELLFDLPATAPRRGSALLF